MDFSPRSRRSRKPPPPVNPDPYSPVSGLGPDPDPESSDLYATMVFKDDGTEDDEEESLPPLLKRLPKDFGGGGDDIGDTESDDGAAAGSISGTMIVKTDRRRSNYSDGIASVSKLKSGARTSFWDRRSPREEEDANVGDFSTFVVRGKEDEEEEEDEVEGMMGTMVRRGGGNGGGGTMRRAVESMQKVGEAGGIGRQRKSGDGASGGGDGGIRHLRQQRSKVSSSSIPESVTREDPSTKYELLHELGKDWIFSFCISVT